MENERRVDIEELQMLATDELGIKWFETSNTVRYQGTIKALFDEVVSQLAEQIAAEKMLKKN